MRTIFSASPRHFEESVEADTLKKVVLHSAATAFASIVLPAGQQKEQKGQQRDVRNKMEVTSRGIRQQTNHLIPDHWYQVMDSNQCTLTNSKATHLCLVAQT